MTKSIRRLILLTLSLLILITVIVWYNKESSKSTFGIDQFTKQMKAKHYSFKVENVPKDNFLPATRKMMVMDKERIFILLYANDKEAKADSKRVDPIGCSYTNGSNSVAVTWSLDPHFYRKGAIIVHYAGSNKKIISDLNDIMGKQFAGSSI